MEGNTLQNITQSIFITGLCISEVMIFIIALLLYCMYFQMMWLDVDPTLSTLLTLNTDTLVLQV